MVEWLKEVTGIYSLGFDKDSFFGLMLPLGIFGLVVILSAVWVFVR